jgi:hypothetical protein
MPIKRAIKTIEADGVTYTVGYPVKRIENCKNYLFEIGGKIMAGYFSHQPRLHQPIAGKSFCWCLYAGGTRVVELPSFSAVPSDISIIGQIVE